MLIWIMAHALHTMLAPRSHLLRTVAASPIRDRGNNWCDSGAPHGAGGDSRAVRPRRGGGCPAGCGLPLCAHLEGHEAKSLVDIRSIDLGDSRLLELVGGSVATSPAISWASQRSASGLSNAPASN